jgi:hypothetical protein
MWRGYLRMAGCDTVCNMETTDDTFLAIWEDAKADGQGQKQARVGGPLCLTVLLSDRIHALALAHLFVNTIFAIPSCTYFNGHRLSLYCGDAGSGWLHSLNSARNLVTGYLVGSGLMHWRDASSWSQKVLKGR